jgi:hypothetical protein
MALLRLYRRRGATGSELAEPLDGDPLPQEAILLRAWQYESDGEWEPVSKLDHELAAIGAHDPGFVPATRLRARWRLRDGTPESAAEALVLIDTLLPLGGSLGDLLLRAHAATVAGLPYGAASSLQELGRKAVAQPVHAGLLKDGLVALSALPEGSISPEFRRAVGSALRGKLRRIKR